jgi:RNA recognition motif-containing protein
MSKSLYIGNLPWRCTSDELLAHLRANGDTVDSVLIVTDRVTGRARGFAFATVPDEMAMQNMIVAYNEKEFQGRKLFINEARPREERPNRSFKGN